MNPSNNVNVWFITGAARGIGLSLARQALAQGDAVVATSRTLASLQQALGKESATLLALEVDLCDESSVRTAIEKAISKFGRIDRVVNNAGYGQQGTIEALSDDELRGNFDVNWGLRLPSFIRGRCGRAFYLRRVWPLPATG